jgi:flagellar biosynthetic protein FliP
MIKPHHGPILARGSRRQNDGRPILPSAETTIFNPVTDSIYGLNATYDRHSSPSRHRCARRGIGLKHVKHTLRRRGLGARQRVGALVKRRLPWAASPLAGPLGRWLLFAVALWLGASCAGRAQTPDGFALPQIPGVSPAHTPQQVANTVQILVLMTLLTVAPSLFIMMTAFTRIIIVLSFLKSALGTQNIPPSQVLVGLAVFLTFFVMQPTFTRMNSDAVQPFMAKKIDFPTAVDRGEIPLRRFMVAQTYRDDLRLFLQMSHTPPPRIQDPDHPADSLPMQVVVPAFIISELKTGFIFGFIIYIPFIIIDLVVAALLMSMGMMMLPPTVISLPAKILVFILADGWHAIAGSLAASFH